MRELAHGLLLLFKPGKVCERLWPQVTLFGDPCQARSSSASASKIERIPLFFIFILDQFEGLRRWTLAWAVATMAAASSKANSGRIQRPSIPPYPTHIKSS